jgi:hypothetical protein
VRKHITEAGAAPVQIVRVETLPRTPMNKIFKPELRRQAVEIAVSKLLEEQLGPDAMAAVAVGRDGFGAITVTCSLAGEDAVRVRDLVQSLGVHYVEKVSA